MIVFRKATPADLPVIERLAYKIWNEVYPGIISQKQIDYMLEKMYSQQSLQKQISEEKHEYTLAFENENLIGYSDTSTENGSDYFLHKLYFDPQFHGKGTAKKLFDLVFSEKKFLKTIRLQVNRKNTRAIGFYKKNGFEIEYQKDFDIGDCFYMCDFVMVKKYE